MRSSADGSQTHFAWLKLCSHRQLMLLERREDAKSPLEPSGVVVDDIALNHVHQIFPTGEAFDIVAFSFEDTPKALHRAIIDAFAYAGHTLRHFCCNQSVMEDLRCVLETSITVKNWMCIRILLYGYVKSPVDKRTVVVVTDNRRNNPPIAQIKGRTEIYLVYFNSNAIFEFSYISHPFFVRPVRL